MAIIFKLTDAGRAALVNAQSTGSAARTLVSVGVTATAFTPTTNLAALPGEIKRLTTIAGDVVADGTIHVTIRDDGPDAYTVRGFGLWLDDGVLLGTYSQPTAIVEKSGASIMMMSTDLRVLDGSADVSTLQFGNTNFIDPPATTERQGVVELATLDEVTAGTDDVRAVTPYTMARRLALKADLTGADFSGAVSATGFSGSGAALTDLAWKNIVGRPTTLTGYGITDGAAGTRKISAGTGLTGGGDLSADRTLALAGTGVNAGSYGSATGVATFTVDAQGRLTAAGSVAVAPAWGSITGRPTTVAGYAISDAATWPNVVTLQNGLSNDISGQNLNTLTRTGFHRGNSLTGAPDSGWWFVVHQSHDDTANKVGWHTQEVTAYGVNPAYSGGTRFVRSRAGSAQWEPWQRIAYMSGGEFSGAISVPGIDVGGNVDWRGQANGNGYGINNLRWSNIGEKPSVAPSLAHVTLGVMGPNGIWETATSLTAPADGYVMAFACVNVGTVAVNGSTLDIGLYLAGDLHSADSTRLSQYHQAAKRVGAGQYIEARLRVQSRDVAPEVTATLRVSLQFIRD